jgi:hypothetical protein
MSSTIQPPNATLRVRVPPNFDMQPATFYTTGMEHSATSATGTGWERTPWHATQRAAWEALVANSEAIAIKAARANAAAAGRSLFAR